MTSSVEHKVEAVDVLIPWIRAVRLQLRERFRQDLLVLRLHSDIGGEFSYDFLRDFCRGEGILQSFILSDSPQQNGIAERRIGLVMELNLWPRVSLPETSPTLHWTGEVGDASLFRVCGSRAFVCDTSTDKLSARAIPCVFLGFVLDAPGWQFYHPTSRRVFPSQNVTFDESVPIYRLFPYRSAPPLPLPLILAPSPPPVDPLSPQGPAPSGVSHVDPLPGTTPVEVVVGSGAASEGAEPGVAESEGAGSRGPEPGGEEPGAEPVGVELGGAEPEGIDPGGAESEGPESGDAEPRGAALSGRPAGASPRLSPQQLHEWLVRCADLRSGATRAGGAGAARAGGTGAAGTGSVGGARAGDPTEPGATRAGGSGAGGAGAGGAGVEGTGAGGAGAGGTVARGARVGGTGAGGTCAGGAGAVDPGGTMRHPTISRLLATAITDPSFESAAMSALIAELLDFAAACRLDYAIALVTESESATPPSVGGECALGTDVLEDRQEDFECLAAAWQVAMDDEMPSWKSTGTYVDEVPQPGANIVDGMWIFKVKRPPSSPPAFKVHYVARGFSQRQGVDYFQTFSPTPKMTTLRVLLHVATQRDYELHSLNFSTAFLQGSMYEEIWLRRPPNFTGSFPAGTQWSLRRPVYGLRKAPREWHDTLTTTLVALGFAPSTADLSLFLRTSTSLPPFYVLVYIDDLVFATTDTEALTLVKSELQKRHTCTNLGELHSYLGLKITRDRARRTITLTHSHMVHQVLQRFGFQFSSPQPTPLSTGHSLSAPPSDESVEPSGPYPEVVGCLISSGKGLVLGGRGPVVLTGHADVSWVDDSATQWSSQGYTFSFGFPT
ncbi:unnamed protein product, partial [Closterium sp. NIES-54]